MGPMNTKPNRRQAFALANSDLFPDTYMHQLALMS